MTIYEKYREMYEELMKHKWIESEKAGKDVEFEWALLDWNKKHRIMWLKSLEKIQKE